jgi:hypothetical protein
MDFSKNIINKGKQQDKPPAQLKPKQLTKMPAKGGKRLGWSPDRINTLTGMKMKEENKFGRGGTRTVKAGSNTQVIRKPK